MTPRSPATARRRWLSAWLLLAAVAGLGAAPPQKVVEVEAGHQRLLVQPSRITRVAVGNPKVADVMIAAPREVLVTGKATGATSLLVWRAGETEPAQLVVQVEPSTRNASTPSGGYQVQIDLKIVELSRRTLHAAGFSSRYTGGGKNQGGLTPPGILSAVEQARPMGDLLLSSAGGFLPIANAFSLVYGHASEGLMAVLSILESNGLAHTLAEPSLVALSGHTATFLAGGEFPIPVVQSGRGGNAVTIEFKEFGIAVALTPTVLGSDRIVLKIAPEVSELDFSNGVQAAGVTVPALVTRRADTTIDLGDGETFALGGLVSRQVVANAEKFPVLGDIPILGAFFKSTRFERQEKELIMVAQAHMVRPIRRGAPLPPLPGEEVSEWNPNPLGFFFLPSRSLSRWAAGFSD